MTDKKSASGEKPNLLIAADTFLPRKDGVTVFLEQVVPTLSTHFDITLLVPNLGKGTIGKTKTLKVPTFSFTLGDMHFAKPRPKAVAEAVAKADIVWVQQLGSIGYYAIREAKKQGKPILMYTHSIDWELAPAALSSIYARAYMSPLAKIYVKRMLSKMDLLMVPSDGIGELLRWQGIRIPQRVISLGVDSQRFKPTDDKRKIKKSLGLPEDKFVIGYHGRLSHEKDIRTLVRGFLRFNSEVRDACLVLVGHGRDAITRDIKQKTNIFLTGAKDDVVPYLQAMDVYAFTSLTETTSLSLLEAMSVGLPVVSTPAGHIRDYINEGKNGFLIRRKDPLGLHERLRKLYKDEELRERVGNEARLTVLNTYNWGSTIADITKVLKEFT